MECNVNIITSFIFKVKTPMVCSIHLDQHSLQLSDFLEKVLRNKWKKQKIKVKKNSSMESNKLSKFVWTHLMVVAISIVTSFMN